MQPTCSRLAFGLFKSCREIGTAISLMIRTARQLQPFRHGGMEARLSTHERTGGVQAVEARAVRPDGKLMVTPVLVERSKSPAIYGVRQQGKTSNGGLTDKNNNGFMPR